MFIDANHTCQGVKQDFEAYRELVPEGGIIVFHDIVPHPNSPKAILEKKSAAGIEPRHLYWGSEYPDYAFDQFWYGMKNDYKTVEFVSHPKQMGAGIGVVKV